MRVKAFVKKLDEVADEELREQYQAVEGGFVLVPEGFDGDAKDYYDKLIAPGLKSALGKEREDKGKLKARIKAFEELGMDPEDIAEIVRTHQETVAAAANKIDPKLMEQITAKHEKEVKARDERIAKLTQQLQSSTVDRDIADAISANNGNPKLLAPFIRQFVRPVVEDGEKVVSRVFMEDGETIRVGDGNAPMTPTEFVRSLRSAEEFQGAFAVEVRNGSGTPTDKRKGPAGKATVKSRKELSNPAEKAAFISQHGLDAFKALPAE